MPEHLIPATEDLHQDTLPVEQHPSYPLGNPYWIHHAPHTLQPAGSSQPKLDPRICSHLAMHSMAYTRKNTLTAVASGSVHAKSAIEPQDDDDNDDEHLPYTIEADGHVELAPHLQLRAQINTTTTTPTWPFKRYGPGPCGRSYAALFRSHDNDLHPDVSVWADLALEELVPRTRPDSYSLPSSLMHPYTQTSSGMRRRARPSGIPPSLGLKTSVQDDEWLHSEEHDVLIDQSTAVDEQVVDQDRSFERELEEWTASEMSKNAHNDDYFGAQYPSVRNRQGVSSSTLPTSSDMAEQQEFCHAILSVIAQRDTFTRQKRQRANSVSPIHSQPSRRKRRSLVPPDAQTDRTTAAAAQLPPNERRWVWGQSRSLREPVS